MIVFRNHKVMPEGNEVLNKVYRCINMPVLERTRHEECIIYWVFFFILLYLVCISHAINFHIFTMTGHIILTH